MLGETFASLREAVFIIDANTVKIIDCNPGASEMFGYSREEIIGRATTFLHVDEAALDEFRKYLYSAIKEKGFLFLPEFRMKRKNGEIFFAEHSVTPFEDDQGNRMGWVSVVRDITERKRTEKALQESEESAHRLAEENAIIAEIGRIISSSLNIDQVYERFANEVRKLIPFDRISINFINLEDRTSTVLYSSGLELGTRPLGVAIPLSGTIAEEVLRTRSPLVLQGENIKEISNRFPNVPPLIQAGFQSIMSVPSFSKDQVIGVLHFRSAKPNAYSERHLTVAERIGHQIAGAIANSRLFIELKKSEEALHTEKKKFQNLSENAPFGIVVIDKDNTFKYINPKFKELFGYDLNDVPDGKTWFRKAYPDPTYRHDVISTWIKDSKSFEPGEKIRRTFTVCCKDGMEKTVFFIPVLLETGEFLMTCEDITERKQAEESLKRSEEEARRLAQENAIVAEIGRIISSTLNIKGVYERFAEEVHKLLSFDRIAINLINSDNNTTTVTYTTGVQIKERSDGGTVPLTGTFTETVMRARKSHLVQDEKNEIISRFPGLIFSLKVGLRSMLSVPLFSKDQVIGVLHLRSTKLNAYTEEHSNLAQRVGNQIAGAIANAQLFAERKQAEEALQKSEKESKQMAQENAIMAEIGRIISSTLNIDDVYERFTEELKKLISFDQITINHVNPEDQTFFIAYASGSEVAGRRQGDVIPLSGTATKEMIRTQSSMIVHLEDKKEVVARFPGLLPDLASGFRTMMVVLLISKDQVIGVLQIHSLKPNAYTEKDLRLAERVGNQIAGAIANAQLFTERLRAEQKAKSLEEQLRQSQKIEAIGRLAGGIAHDFNNLLTVIKGYSELLLAKLKQGDPLKGNLEEIHRASQRATDLTRQLLAFSRRQILEFKILDLNTILRDMDKMLRRILSEDIELVTLFAEGIGKVRTDPGQVEQVILNLAVNARDAMPSGGKLTLETANVELDETFAQTHIEMKPGRYVMLSVSDTGVGMTPEVKEHLFEPFFTTKEEGKGTGLGLSTVYGIVKQSGGDIWVYSEPGQGTTFKIYLPRVEEGASALPHEGDKDSLPRGRETILLVEDELSVRGFAVQVLRENGYNLLEAVNGSEALRMVQEYAGEIHLLLTDVVMPQVGGKELAQKLKALRPNIKVLFTSGYTDNAIVHHGVLEPGVKFLQKPFSPAALAQKVREVLDT